MSDVSFNPVTPKNKVEAPAAESSRITWSPWLAVVFVVAVYFVSQIVGGLIVSLYPLARGWSAARGHDWLQHAVTAQFLYVLIAEGLTLGAVYLFLRYRKSNFGAIGFRRPRWGDVGRGLLIVPVYYVSYIAVVMVAQKLAPSLNVNQDQQLGFSGVTGFGPMLMTFISLVILPPIVEETLVRGYLYTSLKKGMPQLAAVLVTSVIFASGHLQFGDGAPLLWIAAIDTFVLSLFLIYLREKTGSLWASMTLHAVKNGVAFASIFIFHLS